MKGRRPGLSPERLQSVTGQSCFVGLRVLLNLTLILFSRFAGLLPPLCQETQVIECRRRTWRGGIALNHLVVIRRSRIRIFRREALADKVERVRRPLTAGIDP